MAARTLIIRPQMTSLCAFRPRLLSSLAFSSSSPLKYSPPELTIRRNYQSINTVSRRSFCIRATTQVNDPGSIDSPLMQSMKQKIQEHLNAESVSVKDAYGDGRHVSIDVIASTFEGQSAVNRQRMVYKAIWEELQSTVHAVDQMTTRTPTEAESKK
ncbi:hypothetical protein DCAR_0625964 [Daucus carota subsp. sativus]|uniref:BolA-like protein n=2 Tax=Daucus carota subsp. sativus TaxID=79200 RepID=A0A164WSV4_DAUCS|nr:hypothetical protein DCAR_0625964 [Daucus carota subsp. sativus]